MKNMQLQERNVPTVRNIMDRLFEESFWDPFQSFPSLTSSFTSIDMPKSDIYETDKEFVAEIEVPGYDPKNLEVNVENGRVVIQGKTEESKEDKDRHYFRKQRSYGSIYQEIGIPSYVDAADASCKFKNGTLTVHLPKKQKEKKLLSIEAE